MMKRIALATLAGLMVTGCGTTPNAPTFSSVARVPGAASKAAAAQTIKVPVDFAGSGAIAMAFQFPTAASAYHVAATTAQVEKLVVTLKTRSFLLTKTVATAEVTRAQMKNGAAAVRFDGLKAGDYTVAIQAFDAAGSLLGSSEGAAAVAEGKVSPVAIALSLTGGTTTPAPSTSTGGLALTVTITDGGVAPTPKPVPTPAPTVKPVPATGAWNTNAAVLRAASFSGCLFGSSTPIDSAEVLGGKVGRPLDVTHTFYQFDTAFPNATTLADVAAGRVPLISFNAITKAGKNILWADIAAGKQDARLHEVAKGLKSLVKPVFFTFNHEPENDGMRGTPAEYRAAWKRVSDVLAADGVTNAVKVFVCMGGTVSLNESFYPGADVVDWIGADPYNWANTSSQPTAKWRTFETAATPFYTWAKAKNKPLMIGETGCAEDPTNAARKGEWLKEMGETLKKWPEFKALCYFNSNKDDGKGVNAWYVATTNALAGFRQVATDPYFSRH